MKKIAFLLLFLAGLGLGARGAAAAEILTQTVHNADNTVIGNGSPRSLNAGQVEDSGFATTGTVQSIGTSTDSITSVSWLVENDGAGACTGTVNYAGDIYYCTGDTNCTGGARVFDVFDTCDALNVPAGGSQWVECHLSTPVGTPKLSRTWFINGPNYNSVTGCDSAYSRYNSTSVISGSSNYASGAASNTDAAFRVCSGGTDCGAAPDPRPSPEVTIQMPTASGAFTGSNPSYRAATDVCASAYPSESDVLYEFDLEKWDGDSWEDFGGWTTLNQLMVSNGCTSGLAYGTGALPNNPIPVTLTFGSYRIAGRAMFDGFSFGDWSSFVEFSFGAPYGGGGGGTWGGGTAASGDGSYEDWTDYIEGVPSHDDVYGACKLLGLQFDFLGTGESEAGAGDGLPCVWSWVKYAVIPPEDATFNFVARPFDVLTSRWPLSYIRVTWDTVSAAVVSEAACPVPDFFTATDDFRGTNIATLDPCEWVSPLATAVDASAFASGAFVMFLWCAFVAWCVRQAFKFFDL